MDTRAGSEMGTAWSSTPCTMRTCARAAGRYISSEKGFSQWHPLAPPCPALPCEPDPWAQSFSPRALCVWRCAAGASVEGTQTGLAPQTRRTCARACMQHTPNVHEERQGQRIRIRSRQRPQRPLLLLLFHARCRILSPCRALPCPALPCEGVCAWGCCCTVDGRAANCHRQLSDSLPPPAVGLTSAAAPSTAPPARAQHVRRLTLAWGGG